MTFVLEDGTGVESANAYLSVAFAREYFDARGKLSSWHGTAVSENVTAVDADADTLAADYDFETGDGPVTIAMSGAGALPGGLAETTEYWIVAGEGLQLALSYEDATAEEPVTVDITSVGSGTRVLSHPDFVALRAAIVRATDYLELRYGELWIGLKSSAAQGLHFPATGIYDEVSGEAIDGVPVPVAKAGAELALIAKTKDLGESAGAAVSSESRSAGGISRSVTYAAAGATVRYPVVERLLRSLLHEPQAVRA